MPERMRIAYVALHLEKKFMLGGVGRKIRSHLGIWQEMGHEARLYLLTPDEIELPGSAIFPFGCVHAHRFIRAAGRELNRSRALAQLIRAVAAYQPDLIYLRYGLFTPPLQRLFRIAPVVVEVNTDDVLEYRYRGPVFYWFNRLTRGQILGRASGIVPITREIAARPTLAKFHKPTLPIANGIDLRALAPLPTPCNQVPRLAFVGNPGIPWNGVDKLLTFATGAPEIQVEIIGYTQKDLPGVPLPPNLVLHGFVSLERVGEILAGADTTISTLALHRKQLEENSALKVREALAYGIPTVIAYQDTDLSGREFDFLLQIPNREDNVQSHAGLIRNFVQRMVGRRVEREQIAPLIDQWVKEQERIGFFEQILAKA